MARGDHSRAIDYLSYGDDARFSVPTPEHYLPLLYVVGTQFDHEPATVVSDGIDLGSISMMTVRIG